MTMTTAVMIIMTMISAVMMIMTMITAVMIVMMIITMITAVCGRCLSLQPALASPLSAVVWRS